MVIRKMIGSILALSLLVVVFQNCSQQKWVNQNTQSPDGDLKVDPRNPAALVTTLDAEIQKMIADKSCNTDADCSSVAYGVKACGGPKKYLVYSLQSTNAEELNALVNQFNAQDRAQNEALGLISTCNFEMEPQVSCVEKLCQAHLSPESSPL